MSLVITRNFVVAAGADYTVNNPLIGYENLTTISNVSATSEDTDYPATNLANPATNLTWKGENSSPIGDIYLTVIVDRVDPIDYVAIAKHNLATGQITVSVEGLADNTESPTNWVELCSDVILAENGPAMFCFAAQSLYAVRLRLQPSNLDVVPQIAVLYTGKLLTLQRRIYVNHTPINYATAAKIVNAKSESGNFLGRIVLNEWNSNNITLQNLTPDWVRASLMPFIQLSREFPFFFAWRPSDYPQEVGYCWMTNDPQPVNQLSNGMMSIQLNMTGVV